MELLNTSGSTVRLRISPEGSVVCIPGVAWQERQVSFAIDCPAGAYCELFGSAAVAMLNVSPTSRTRINADNTMYPRWWLNFKTSPPSVVNLFFSIN
jgi:hypothetical protein